jgi:Protein of unknown function (DUF1501)
MTLTRRESNGANTPVPRAWSRDLLCRRAFLGRTGAALGGLALASLLGEEAAARAACGASPRATAKRVIMLFMSGGLSQIELFDEKPVLNERRGEDLPASVRNGKYVTKFSEAQGASPVVGSPFPFRAYGKCGTRLSSLLPNLGARADDFTLIRSMQTDTALHETAISVLLTGTPLLGRPSWGSWLSYGLGSANRDLPEFVVLLSSGERQTPLQSRMWHSGFLPGRHQGVQFRGGGDPVLFVSSPPGVSKACRQRVLDAVKSLDEIAKAESGDPETDARIESYEMAARLQTSVPELADLASEPRAVLERYGAEPGKSSFANNCLMARRLAERGVRFVQVCDGGWDHHYSLPYVLPPKCKQIDQPVGALLEDLKQRGLLGDTIVILCGEFGRAPFVEGPLSFDDFGRDHNPKVGSLVIAGGGFKAGHVFGRTDDWGWDVVENAVHVHDLQATVLHALGIDHTTLVYRHQGRDFRLTDVGGEIVPGLLA